MADQFKQCKQCGKMLPLTNFRKYYGGRTGYYKYCLVCEKINNREKYLSKKTTLTDAEAEEYEKIQHLWHVQRMNGLQPPHNSNQLSVASRVEDLLADYDATSNAVVEQPTQTETGVVIPAELQEWLTKPLTEDPDYYQNTVYEELRDKYRPIMEINQDTLMPVYDDTYKPILNEILDRFDDYEDNYDWDKED